MIYTMLICNNETYFGDLQKIYIDSNSDLDSKCYYYSVKFEFAQKIVTTEPIEDFDIIKNIKSDIDEAIIFALAHDYKSVVIDVEKISDGVL